MDAKPGERLGPEESPSDRIDRAVAAVERDGARRTLYRMTLKAINTVVGFKILRGVWVESPDPAFLQYPQKFTTGFLSDSMIRRFAADPENGMDEDFVEEALSK